MEFSPGQVRSSERSPGLAPKYALSPGGAARSCQSACYFPIGDNTTSINLLLERQHRQRKMHRGTRLDLANAARHVSAVNRISDAILSALVFLAWETL